MIVPAALASARSIARTRGNIPPKPSILLVVRAFLRAADAVTVPSGMLRNLAMHPLTNKGTGILSR